MNRSRLIANLLVTSALAGGARAGGLDEAAQLAVTSRPVALEPSLIDESERAKAPEAAFATMIASLSPEAGDAALAVKAPLASDAGADENEGDVLFEADLVTRETEESPILAEGDVRAYFGKRFLKADKLSYDPSTDIVIAEGNVSITDENMQTAFAGRVQLTGDLRDGVAENFSALLEDNARLAGEMAIREQGARTKLSHAVYTACNVCKSDGKPKVPTWRIKALKVTRDEERKVVRFHHAFLELKGVPILYAPFLQGPDPSVERQSGFLTPVIGASSRLGFNFELPYYLAISNHEDATFSPKYTSKDGVLWQGEYRRRDKSGYHVIQAGVINFDKTSLDENGNPLVDVPGVRWHFFAQGYRNFGEHWRAGYDVERVSDDTYLRRYDVERRGDLREEFNTANTNRLRSNAYIHWDNNGSEFTSNAYLFQGLRSTDDSSLTPYVLPLMNFRHDFSNAIGGGRANVNINFASLQRTRGVDDQRLTASASWNREYITPSGHRFNAFAEVRGDGYYFHDLNEGTETISGITGEDNKFVGRFAPTAGVEWSYPLTRRLGPARLFIEPRIQLAASPVNANPSSIINEDSQSVEFDYAGLFEFNKATGYDRFEDGQRANVGASFSAQFDNGLTLEAEAGQQFRLQTTDAFDASTGLGSKQSDIVGALNVSYKGVVGVENRFRIDNKSGAIQRAESFAYFNWWRFNSTVNYVRLNEENATTNLARREELTGNMQVRLTNHWKTGMGWRQDLVSNRTIRKDILIGYFDECSTFTITYRRDSTRDVGLTPDNAVLIQFTLRSLVD